jgi:hypothetical protein
VTFLRTRVADTASSAAPSRLIADVDASIAPIVRDRTYAGSLKRRVASLLIPPSGQPLKIDRILSSAPVTMFTARPSPISAARAGKYSVDESTPRTGDRVARVGHELDGVPRDGYALPFEQTDSRIVARASEPLPSASNILPSVPMRGPSRVIPPSCRTAGPARAALSRGRGWTVDGSASPRP